jgi:ABC-2 type transport system ATP-binding protein
MNNLAIEIKNLKKIYQKSLKSPPKQALSGINLEIKKGSFFALLGPTGAGKSTIINILAGIVNKTSGKVSIAGIDIDNQMQEAKFKIGIVPQELIIDPFFNVYETLEFYAGYYGVDKKKRRTNEIIEALGLKDKIKSAPRTLSGGMKRRLLVAKALVHNPEILVLDEPTAGVDVELRNQLWQYVSHLNNEYKTTIVLTTHYLEEAEKLCSEIAIIDNGKIIMQKNKDKMMQLLNSKKMIIVANNINDLTNDFIKQQIDKNGNDKKLDIDKNDSQLTINYDPTITNIKQILSALNGLNIDIQDLSTNQPNLEEIFRYLIKNQINNQ